MKIKEAAIWFNGVVYVGRRHSDIIKNMVKKHNVKPPCSGHQGFITEDGDFVGRTAAAKIAFKAKQIDKQVSTLYSEDLY